MLKWVVLVVGIGANAGASILIKIAVSRIETPGISWLDIALSPSLVVGLILYGITFAAYALALAHLPLHVVHPVLTAGAIAVVAASSVFVFNEFVSLPVLIGIMLVSLGVILITIGTKQ
ncbi:hypothetical protein [Thiohalobacter sp.]|uniref:hypothetical protein n=1 Tax=Thiohalobacter sp. TaxID=2025948 RepID=UPI002624AFE3|nr:hypothetical protein [Thiohalobacter sp.]